MLVLWHGVSVSSGERPGVRTSRMGPRSLYRDSSGHGPMYECMNK